MWSHICLRKRRRSGCSCVKINSWHNSVKLLTLPSPVVTQRQRLYCARARVRMFNCNRWCLCIVSTCIKLLLFKVMTKSPLMSVTPQRVAGKFKYFDANNRFLKQDYNIPSKEQRRRIVYLSLSLIHIWRCRRAVTCRSRWSPYH